MRYAHPTLLALLPLLAVANPLPFTGVSLAGAEFGPVEPGKLVYGKSYIYPDAREVVYFASKGMNVFRIPFHWEAMQPTSRGPLDPAELARLKSLVGEITRRGLTAILDPHNYARYRGELASPEELASLWRGLAREFKGDDHVWFGLMNEPHDMRTEDWLAAANASLATIRSVGAKNLVLVPGNHWTGAHSWTKTDNGTVMLDVKDPLGRWAYDVHQYLDADSSGSHPKVVSPAIGAERLQLFVAWCRAHKRRAFLGEFGAAAAPEARAAVAAMLAAMQDDRDVWLGWTYWAAGPWWGDYMFSIEPKDSTDRPALTPLLPFLQKRN